MRGAGSRLPVLIALFCAALTLRPQIVGIGPLIPEIQDDLGGSHALVGLVGTIPVLAMGVFAPVGAVLASRIGTRNGMTLGLALLAVFGLVRTVAPTAILLVLLTIPVGIGMGIANALSPLAVRQRLRDRAALGTGVYTTGIQIGSTVSAALAVPLAALLGGWRAALAAFSVVSLGLCLAWILLMRGEGPHVRGSMPHLPFRSRTAWLLVGIFATMGAAYYGLNAWLSDAYTEHGWSAAAAGGLIAAMNLTAIPSSFFMPWLSERRGRQRMMEILTAIFLAGALGLVTLPALGYAWCLLAGLGQGGMFALVMTTPLDLEERPERVGGLVAMMLGLGYTFAAAAPFVLGAARDATGSFEGPLWVAVGCIVALQVLVRLLGRVRHVATSV